MFISAGVLILKSGAMVWVWDMRLQVSMTTVKNFVLLGDVLKSVFFLHFREDKEGAGGKHLLQLAKDFESLQVCLLSDEPALFSV